MRRLLLVLVLEALVLASAAVAASDRSVSTQGTVTGMARSGYLVAFASTGTATDCRPVHLWNLTTRGVIRFGSPHRCPPATSTGSGLVGPVLGGNRALWLTYIGGNTREWSLWTASTTTRTPRRLRFIPRPVDDPAPLVLGDGSDTVLPYALGDTVIALWPSGARRFAWQAPTRVAALSASRDRVVVLLADGSVVELSAAGAVLRTLPPTGEVIVARSAIGGVVIERKEATGDRGLELYRGGTLVRQAAVPRTARLLDYGDGVALYRLGRDLHGIRLVDGRDLLLRSGSLGVLEPSGLSYVSGHTVFSVARSQLGV